MLPIYSSCLAHAHDNTQLSLIEVGSAILMVNSVGAMTGPFLFSFAMRWMDSGYFVVSGILLLAFSLWTVARIRGHEVERSHFEPFRNLPGTTQGSIALSETAVAEEVESIDPEASQPPSVAPEHDGDQRRNSRPSGS